MKIALYLVYFTLRKTIIKNIFAVKYSILLLLITLLLIIIIFLHQ